MRHFIKIVYLILLFCGSVWFFSGQMERRLSSASITTTEQKEPALPVIEISAGNININKLYGYTTELNPLLPRECFALLTDDNIVTLVVNDRKSDVRKVLYDVYDTETGEKLFDGQVSAFEYTENTKDVRLKLDYEYEYGREYAVQITAITSESQRVFYYFRLKKYDNAFFAEKLAFINEFSERCRSKDIQYVIPYLESTYRGLSTSFAKVDITDSYQMICWGDLEPKVISDIAVTINEIYKYICVATLKYTVELDNPSGKEQYEVIEHFRINLGQGYVYLLGYERNMESIFDNSLTSVSQSEFKLGITDDTDVQMAHTQEGSMLAFVRNNSLYFYNLAEDNIYTVYTNREENVTYTDQNHECNLKILRMDDSGNVSFMLSGYFSKGEYEGKTGIILYKYYRSENRIEELLYIPITQTNQYIQQELGGFAYLSSTDIFYFLAYDRIYSYNITTNSLRELTGGAAESNIIFCEELSYAAWQEKGDLQHIYIYYLEEGKRDYINVAGDNIIKLYTNIGLNMIIGYGKETDSSTRSDGHRFYPITDLTIINPDKKELKRYAAPGYYIVSVEATDTAVKMERVKKLKDTDTTYVDADSDFILIKNLVEEKSFETNFRATELMLREYYLSMPSQFSMKALPKLIDTPVTVVKENTTARLQELDSDEPRYQVYSFGRIISVTDSLPAAIEVADTKESAGVVINGEGTVEWERGVANRSASLTEGTKAYALGLSEVNFMMNQATSLDGVDVAASFYYIWQDIPVFAMPDNDTIILITDYTQTSVSYINVKTGRSYVQSITRLRDILAANGNIIWVVNK